QTQRLVLVNAANEARWLDIRSGRVSEQTLGLPDVISDILFSSRDSRVLLRTPRWVHRTAISPSGLIWLDAIRAPKALPGSRMVLDTGIPAIATDDSAATRDNAGGHDRLLVLTRETGFAEVAELQFDYSSGPALVGNRQELLDEWRKKLAVPQEELAAESITLPAISPAID
ncbi:MAG: hypothetical protein OEY72_07905, partial [Gammaproteobacteria bacterium]|nr:hypothetical protein [Gammaproteobacteria bacterium]